MMFAKQAKDVVFLETVMGLAQQRRHCMIECIPLPQDIAKEAPSYFKKVRFQTASPYLFILIYHHFQNFGLIATPKIDIITGN